MRNELQPRAGYAVLQGTLTDSAGAGLSGAKVSIPFGIGQAWAGETDSQGRFSFQARASDYASVSPVAVVIEKAGYRPSTVYFLSVDGEARYAVPASPSTSPSALATGEFVPKDFAGLLHLGDANFSGAINWQLQTATRGRIADFQIKVWTSEDRAQYSHAVVEFVGRGVQGLTCKDQIGLALIGADVATGIPRYVNPGSSDANGWLQPIQGPPQCCRLPSRRCGPARGDIRRLSKRLRRLRDRRGCRALRALMMQAANVRTRASQSAASFRPSRAAFAMPLLQPLIDDTHARQLLSRCARREERALVELHRLLARRIHAFAWQRLRNDEEAQTVVVDTLYEVWKSASRFRGESLVTTWVLGIARFKSMELRRHVPPDADDIDDHVDTLAADTEDGEAALHRWQEAEGVRRCLTQLSAAHRECMQLVYYEGMGLAEVALVQHVPENTVKTRLFHARRLMRACVEGSGDRHV